MEKYTLVSLSKPVDSKGLSVGDIGIIIECKPHDVFDVMFFNKNALGDYLVAKLFRKDFERFRIRYHKIGLHDLKTESTISKEKTRSKKPYSKNTTKLWS